MLLTFQNDVHRYKVASDYMTRNERDGSAHSDYFSLNDEPQNEETADRFKSDPSSLARQPSEGYLSYTSVKALSNNSKSLEDNRALKEVNVSRSTSFDKEYASSNIMRHDSLAERVDSRDSSDSQGVVDKEATSVSNRNSEHGSSGVQEQQGSVVDDITRTRHESVKRFNVDSNRDVVDYRLQGSASAADDNVQNVTHEAMEVIGQNLDRRKQIMKYKNQEISEDNPLFISRENSYYNFSPRIGSTRARSAAIPLSPKLKPLSNYSNASDTDINKHCEVFQKQPIGPINPSMRQSSSTGSIACSLNHKTSTDYCERVSNPDIDKKTNTGNYISSESDLPLVTRQPSSISSLNNPSNIINPSLTKNIATNVTQVEDRNHGHDIVSRGFGQTYSLTDLKQETNLNHELARNNCSNPISPKPASISDKVLGETYDVVQSKVSSDLGGPSW